MSQNQSAIEEEVRDLLERAGPRPAVAAEELAAIKEAARHEWRAVVEAERRRRRGRWLPAGAAVAASALLALALGWWWTSRSAAPVAGTIATVELLRGEVRLDGSPDAMRVGSGLVAGAALETMAGGAGSPARVALQLADGQSVRLDAGSRVRLLSGRSLELERGALYLDSGPDPTAGAAVEIVTRLGTVRDIGTQFEVRLSAGEAAIRVRVREGKVTLDTAGESHLAANGEQLSMLPDGSIVRAAVEPYGSEWEWVMAAAPAPEIEGGSLGSFLDWYARETGRRVRYASDEVERAAESIRLHAPRESLTPPSDAVGSVLAASGLEYRLENGSVLIRDGAR